MLKLIICQIKNDLFIIFLFLVLRTNSEQIKYPLKLINSTFDKYYSVKKVFIEVNSLTTINSFNSFHKKFLQNSKQSLSCEIEVLNSLLFSAEIELGSNGQKFNVILDTGSQILWVPENNSFNINNNMKNFYFPNKSTTSQKTNKEFEVIYGTGYCQGYFYKDLLKFLSNDKYEIYFGLANNSIFDVDGADGILGLARTYPNNLLSPMLTLKDRGYIKTASFSFKYNNVENSLYMYAGKPHKDFETKNIAFCNLLSDNDYEKMLWACKLNSFGFIKNKSNIEGEDNIFIKSNISVIFDTGTNVILLPYELLYSFKEKIKKYNCAIGSSSALESDNSVSFVVCFDEERIPDISLQFNDYILILNKYKMFFVVNFGYGIRGYLLHVQFQKNLNIAIIGQNFFTEFHTLFDPENQVLKFYSDYKDKIFQIKIGNNEQGNNSGIIFFFLIIICLLVAYFYYRNKKKKNIDNNYEWMGPNDGNNLKYNNINSNI